MTKQKSEETQQRGRGRAEGGSVQGLSGLLRVGGGGCAPSPPPCGTPSAQPRHPHHQQQQTGDPPGPQPRPGCTHHLRVVVRAVVRLRDAPGPRPPRRPPPRKRVRVAAPTVRPRGAPRARRKAPRLLRTRGGGGEVKEKEKRSSVCLKGIRGSRSYYSRGAFPSAEKRNLCALPPAA